MTEPSNLPVSFSLRVGWEVVLFCIGNLFHYYWEQLFYLFLKQVYVSTR